MTELKSAKAGPFGGRFPVPGDKSISHRALMIGASAVGETAIQGLLESADVMASADALRRLGVGIQRDGRGSDAVWRVHGRGVGGLAEPDGVLDLGNSGTGARLLMGLLAAHRFTCLLTGDASLRQRPMERVMAPLRRMGASFDGRSGGRLPVAETGSGDLVPATETLAVASAQVKSAILLAGLGAPGETEVTEPLPTRDHTERLLRHFGAQVTSTPGDDGANVVTLAGQPELAGTPVTVPGDFSSAAFPLVAALLISGSRVTLPGVGVNPLRTGLLETLGEMGADIALENRREEGGEPVADLVGGGCALRGVTVPAHRAPAMIDEYPILAVAAALAEGPTRFQGVGELRVKESDRLAAITRGLEASGVRVEEGADSLLIEGTGRPPKGGTRIESRLDHRVAMAFLVLGTVTDAPIAIDDGDPIETSFPGFVEAMNGLGARIAEAAA